jgi:ABC-2 type transport system ATP-binding protein
MNAVVQLNQITHCFGSRVALNQVSFNIAPGEVFGLLGPNGAGKTTTIRLLNGLYIPASGSMRVLGLDPVKDGAAVRSQTGVLTETPALYERLTARQNLRFFGTLAGLNDADLARRIDEMLAFFELSERADDKVGGYSKGMKQRLALARALIHKPALVFLDEPTSGLDPEAAQQVHALIQQIGRDEGHTVVLCTHRLDKAEKLCTRMAILNQGELRAVGSLAELRQQAEPGLWVAVDLLSPCATVATGLSGVPGVLSVRGEGARFDIQVADLSVVPTLADALVGMGARLTRLQSHEESLEQVYFSLQEGVDEH